MVVKPKVLLNLSEKCIRSFNPKVEQEDGYADSFLEAEGVKDEAAKMFIKQVFYGCRRYRKLLEVSMLHLLAKGRIVDLPISTL